MFPTLTSSFSYFEDQREEYYSIWNTQGEILQSGFGRFVDLSNMSSGLYFVSHEDGTNKYVDKVFRM